VNANEPTRAVFAGTPDFAVPSLQALIDAGVAVECVLTQPDRPAGRGRLLTESPIKRLAGKHRIPVLQPLALDAKLQSRLPGTRPACLVVVAYGLILPQWLLDWPTVAPINVHASLLPRWRGASPVQQAVLAGDIETGVSVMHMTRGLDCGPVYLRHATPIGPSETAGELHDRLSVLGGEALVESLSGIVSGVLYPEPQNDARASYAPKIEKRNAMLDWRRSALELERQVRAYNPWPVAEARSASHDRLRIWRAEAVGDTEASQPGEVVSVENGNIDVATAHGLLRLKQVQAPGGRVMSAGAFVAAHDLRGTVFVGPQ
jgi:methionyl-tRNA formyltransferase